jgi:hypothetical protein
MSRNTNAYLNALHQEQKKAISNASSAANHATRKILHASGKIKNVHPRDYDPVAEKNARNAIYDASDASWKTLLAAEKTYQKGNHAPATKEKEAAQKTHELQTFMSEITTNMDTLMNPQNARNRPRLRNTVHRKILLAKNQAKDVKNVWEQLSKHSSQEAGGKTRRNKKSRRSRRSRRSRH